jgi:NAD(P)-dependent dehydrogenase (short-subunit alcohol dehydrogenase family)
MKHEIPAMLASGGGAIVNIASVSGMRGEATQAAYSAAKGGVLALQVRGGRVGARGVRKTRARRNPHRRDRGLLRARAGDPRGDRRRPRDAPSRRAGRDRRRVAVVFERASFDRPPWSSTAECS